jgi:hypothetical protein
MIYSVYAVNWTEYERGWGQRPDGVSYHKSKEAAEKYVSDYDKEFNNESSVPDCYSKGSKPHLVEVDKKIYNEVMKKEMIWKKQ